MREPPFWWRHPGVAAALLSPFAFAYGAIAAPRLKRVGRRAGVPVVCIGNPTVGGAGKRPVALKVARMLLADGVRPVFLSRGYGGRLAGPVRVDPTQHRASDVGDEPIESYDLPVHQDDGHLGPRFTMNQRSSTTGPRSEKPHRS